MVQSLDRPLRIGVAILLIALALVRTFVPAALSQQMDALFFTIVGVALVLLVLPLERLTSVKAGGVEVTLQQAEVRGAIAGLNLDRIRDTELRARLAESESQLRIAHGARVLWIDDRPHTVVAERRLMRSLGIEVVPATSSEAAGRIMEIDNDFDLIITDVQRQGDTFRVTGGVDIHEGVNYVVWLRTLHRDPVMRNVAVVFYAAYDWKRLVEFTRPARELQPEPEISNSVSDLMPKVLRRLAEVRRAPIPVTAAKEPTWASSDS